MCFNEMMAATLSARLNGLRDPCLEWRLSLNIIGSLR